LLAATFASIPNRPAEAACFASGVIGISSSGYETGNPPGNTMDGSLATRWSNEGKGSWIKYNIGTQKTLCYVDVAWYKGNERQNSFVISTSTDGVNYTDVYSGKSSGSTLSPERYDFPDRPAKYIMIKVMGNTQNNWSSIAEVSVLANGQVVSTSPPYVKITSPTTGASLKGSPTATVNVVGVASSDIGVEKVEVRTSATSYKLATPKSAGDWSTWTHQLLLTQGYNTIIAKVTDKGGTSKWNVISVNVEPVSVVSSASKDRFGITKLYATTSGGLEWTANWNNSTPRSFTRAVDPYDKWFDAAHGEGSYVVDGKGKLTAKGDYVRMYVHDPAKLREWSENLEITVYIKRISETKTLSYSGLQIFARTNHGTIGDEDSNLCDSRGYGAKVKTDGTWSFEKETAHHLSNGYADPGGVQPWSILPKGTEVGVKYVIRNMPGDQVKLELYRDLTGGLDGGNWEKVYEFTDNGKNLGVDAGACEKGVDPALPLIRSLVMPDSETAKPMITVYLRHEFGTMEYSDFSIREISPYSRPS